MDLVYVGLVVLFTLLCAGFVAYAESLRTRR
jgi:hypothetical protein